MFRVIRAVGAFYLAIALVVLGIQLPIRAMACSDDLACVISFAKAPVWALAWPIYLRVAFTVPPVVKGSLLVIAAFPLAVLFYLAAVKYLPCLAERSGRTKAKDPRHSSNSPTTGSWPFIP